MTDATTKATLTSRSFAARESDCSTGFAGAGVSERRCVMLMRFVGRQMISEVARIYERRHKGCEHDPQWNPGVAATMTFSVEINLPDVLASNPETKVRLETVAHRAMSELLHAASLEASRLLYYESDKGGA